MTDNDIIEIDSHTDDDDDDDNNDSNKHRRRTHRSNPSYQTKRNTSARVGDGGSKTKKKSK